MEEFWERDRRVGDGGEGRMVKCVERERVEDSGEGMMMKCGERKCGR